MGVEVSIILPCYNIEDYLEKCINSIHNQTFKKFEALFIDDGSTDNTVIKFNELKPDSRFKLFSKKNEGSGSARNYGLDLAKGDYIYFMDPDDIISFDLLEDNINIIKKNLSDINIFGYQTTEYSTGKTQDIIPQYKGTLKTREDIYAEIFMNSNNISISTVWNKFYKHSFLIDNNLRFSNLRVGQDFEFNLHVFDYVESVTVIPEKYYTYFKIRPGSVRTEYNPYQFQSEKIILKTLINKANKWGKTVDFQELITDYKIYIVFGELINLKKTKTNNSYQLTKDNLYIELKRMKYRGIKSKMSRIKLMIIKYPRIISLISLNYIPVLFQ